MPTTNLTTVPHERIVSQIHVIRSKKVMLDQDLAELYGVETRALTQAVRRNRDRFPDDFMFQLTWEEAQALRSQTVILEEEEKRATRSQNNASKRGQHTKYRPYVFTEQGVAMLSSVLRSKRAIQINLLIIRAFVRMREMLETNHVLRERLAAMEQQLGSHNKDIQSIYRVLQRLLAEPAKPKPSMGFKKPR